MSEQRNPNRAIPWDEIEREYVYGKIVVDEISGKKTNVFPSQAELAKKYGVADSSLWKHCNEKNWMVLRQKYLAEFKQKIKKESLRELFIARNKNAGRILQQVEGCQRLVDYILGQYWDILEHDGENKSQFDFRDFDPEQIGKVSPRDLKTVVEIIRETKILMEDILKLDPTLYEEMRGMSEEPEKEMSREAQEALRALEKRMVDKRDRKKRDTLQNVAK